MDEISDLHAGRAGDFAPFAVHAELQVLVEKEFVFEAKPLSVRAGLLRTRKGGIDRYDRAIHGTDRTLDALLKIIETDIPLLHSLIRS